jgi:tetratricopeptide (TPR) repeat protein
LDAALKEYKTASKKLPLAYLYMGNVYFQQENFSEAEKSYLKAIRKTGTPQAYNNLAWLYYKTGKRLKDAEQLAAKAVVLSPATEEFKDTLDQLRKENRPQ